MLRFLHRLREGEIVFTSDNFASAFLFQFTAGVAGNRTAFAGGLFVLRKTPGVAGAGDFVSALL